MDLSSDFWNAYKGLVVVGNGGAIAFTRLGRMRFAPLLAKYGFALDHVKNLERFREVITCVNAGELEVNTLELERILTSPLTSETELEIIRLALATGPTV